MNIIKRWWQRKGFGIESKTDFAFLHDVIREQLPFYAYSTWLDVMPTATKAEQAQAALLLRIANYLQPTDVRIIGTTTLLTTYAINCGCRTANITRPTSEYTKLLNGTISARIEAGYVAEFFCNNSKQQVLSALIITDIEKSNAPLWEEVIKSPAITYDMRTLGIALLRKDRYPEHYNI